MFIQPIDRLFCLICLCSGTYFACAMQRTESAVNVREVRNQSPKTVYLQYTTPEGRRVVRPVGPQEVWQGYIEVPTRYMTLAVAEPTSGTVFHVVQADPSQLSLAQRYAPYYVPMKLRRAFSSMDFSHLTNVKITENYTQEYVRSVDSPDGALRLTVSPLAFTDARGIQSGLAVERLTPSVTPH